MEFCPEQHKNVRPVLVTGCTPGGIGHATARLLKKKGFYVIASCRKEGDLELIRKDCFDLTLLLDMEDTESIINACNNINNGLQGAPLYGIFHNAGYAIPGALEDVPAEAMRKQFETNFFGIHALTRMVLPGMLKKNEGRIVLNSSVLGFSALPYRGAYVASKFALEGWSDVLRQELKGTNIHVSVIQPGPILTKFRINALMNFREWVDAKSTRHAQAYQSMVEKLGKPGPAAPFTGRADDVAKKVCHAMQSRNPRTRYRITPLTIASYWMKKTLSDKMMDKLAGL